MEVVTLKVFVYGTLKRDGRLFYNMGTSTFLGEATLKSYDMLNIGAFPGIVPGTREVHGEVFEVSPKILDLLDHIEGVKWGMYKREEVQVEMGDVRLDAFAYVWNREVQLGNLHTYGRNGTKPIIEDGTWRNETWRD